MPFTLRGRMALRFFLLIALPAAGFFQPLAAQTLHTRPKSVPVLPSAPTTKAAASAEPAGPPTLPAGTTLQVETVKRYGMKKGEAIEARLMHPVFVQNRMVVAAGTMLRGRVVDLKPDRHERLMGRLNGDFTPFRTPVVQFDALELPGGVQAIDAAAATDGAPVLNLRTPHATKRKSLLAREWDAAKQSVRDQIHYFTPPGLKQRMLSLLYHQLPYHPQWIPENTAWSFELRTPVELPDDALPDDALADDKAPEAGRASKAAAVTSAGQKTDAQNGTLWHVHAVLEDELTSATAKAGDEVRATVVEPVFDGEKRLVVPEGAVLVGKVTQSRAARSLGRNGKLRFNFEEVQFPEGTRRQVQGELGGAATNMTQNLKLDAEGTVTPRSQRSAIAPLLLTVLAVKGLDQDGNLAAHTAAASNGFGLVGRVVGVASGSRSVAAGIGMYAAALSFSNNFLRHGRDVEFPRDTRIEIETTPMRAPVLRPTGQ